MEFEIIYLRAISLIGLQLTSMKSFPLSSSYWIKFTWNGWYKNLHYNVRFTLSSFILVSFLTICSTTRFFGAFFGMKIYQMVISMTFNTVMEVRGDNQLLKLSGLSDPVLPGSWFVHLEDPLPDLPFTEQRRILVIIHWSGIILTSQWMYTSYRMASILG